MKKPRLYHTRYLEGYKDGLKDFLDILEHVAEHYMDNETADDVTRMKAIQLLVDERVKVLSRIEAHLN